jgi:hypothetical protein
VPLDTYISTVIARGQQVKGISKRGPVEVRRARVRDRSDVVTDERICFTSSILPKWTRRTKSFNTLLPVLDLRGVSTGYFSSGCADFPLPILHGRALPARV